MAEENVNTPSVGRSLATIFSGTLTLVALVLFFALVAGLTAGIAIELFDATYSLVR